MFHFPWLAVRQAREALRSGRPEDAHRIIEPKLAEGYRSAVRMAREIARAYVAAGEKALRADDPETAWLKLLAAEALNTGEPRAMALRTALTRLGLAECRAALEAGNPHHVVETVSRMRGRNAYHADFETLDRAARDWIQAHDIADRGDFLLAATTAEKVRSQLGNVPAAGLDRFLQQLTARNETLRGAVSALTAAAAAGDWKQASELAASVIAVAPNHREARNVQFRAWDQVQCVTSPYVPSDDVVPLVQSPQKGLKPSTIGGVPKRFLLWIDGVGGFLVCLAPRVTFGQATAEAPVDVPLLADVSRLHAEISRDAEGYVLESGRGALLNSQPVTRTLLKPNDRVTLGSTCQFLFHQPLDISPTARLELVSGHRLHVAVDGVLLMAENIILGPPGQSHIAVPWLSQTIVLYRSKEGIGVRIPGEFRVDAKMELNRAILPLPAVVSSDFIHFAVEPAGGR